jgi:hypothetical protein
MGANLLKPEELAALAELPGLEAEQANLQRQLAAAAAIRGQPLPRHSTGFGAALGGLGRVFSEIGGIQRSNDLEAQMQALLARRAPAEAAGARLKALMAQQGLEKGALDLSAGKQRMEIDKAEADRAARPVLPMSAALINRLTPGLPMDGVLQSDIERAYGPAGNVASLGDARAERNLRREERAAGKEAAAKKQAMDTEEGLRKEFTGNKLTKDTLEVAVAYQKVQQASQDPSGASDMALIFGLMKILDPGSTVREGEYATAQNTGSIPDRVVGAYNRALTGKKLDDDVRKDFVSAAGKAYAGQVEQFKKLEGTYQGLAKGSGVDPSRVAIPLGVGAPTGGAGASKPADAAALQWLQANPNHPDAAAVRQRLQQRGVGP